MLKRRNFLKTAGATTAATLIARRSSAAKLSAANNASLPAADPSDLQEPRSKPNAPRGLLVNGVSHPLAIERDTTRFTWRSVAAGRGQTQTAYQILVSSHPAHLAAGTAVYWDSGKVASDQSASVEYAGKPLPPATRCWWKLRTWDQTGKSSPYSEPAFFDTGLNRNEWTAQYIWDGTANENNFAYLRKSFSVADTPKLAKVYVTAHNDYLLYLNGHLLGRGPARSDPYRYGQYNAYDITQLVHTGVNVFAAIGHWQGNWNDSGTNAKPAFRLEARLDYPDAPSSTIATDNSWKVLALTPFIESDPTYFGGAGGAKNRAAIRFDSRLEPAGWRSAAFDDSSWAAATVVDRSEYQLFAQMAPLEREQATLEPVSVTRKDDAWLVDLGRCIDGWPKLTMRANRPGDTVRVQYFQMSGERKPAGWDEYICRGGNETWDADFGRHTSFQLLKITGYAGKLRASDVRGVSAYCDADVAGRFRCSSPLLNSICRMCVRSAQQNIQQGIISVDANREQSPWLADSWIVGNVLLYNDRDTTMIDKVVRDYAAEQMTGGNFYACSPASKYQIAEWSMYWPMLLWQQYLFSGDTTLLREMAPHLTRFLNWIKTYQDPTTKLLNPPGWRISDYAGGDMPSGGYNVATASQYYENLRIASRIFSALGQTDQSSEYAHQAEAVRTGINANLFNGHSYLARTDRKEIFPLASAWPLRFDIEQPEEKLAILDTILQAGKPDIGGYGGDALYSGLLNAGGGAFVVQDLARYRPMLQENKTCWETFTLGNGEANHAWTSYPGYLFLKYILGIQPTSGGFATFDVRPETGGLAFAEGTVPTVKGAIRIHWEKDTHGRLRLSVDVPANTRAHVYIPRPATQSFTLTESGTRLWPATSAVEVPGVLSVQPEGSAIRCDVGSGAYRFTVF